MGALPLNFQMSLAIAAVFYALRLRAFGRKLLLFFSVGPGLLTAQTVRPGKKMHLSLQKGGSRSIDTQPAADWMPEGICLFSGTCLPSLGASDWTKKGGLGSPQRFLVPFCAYKKVPGSGAGSPGIQTPKRLASKAREQEKTLRRRQPAKERNRLWIPLPPFPQAIRLPPSAY